MNYCDKCNRRAETTSYTVEGIACTFDVNLCETCAVRAGLAERTETVEQLLARIEKSL